MRLGARTLAAAIVTAAMAVGLIVEGVIFRTIEAKTIRRWGMQHG